MRGNSWRRASHAVSFQYHETVTRAADLDEDVEETLAASRALVGIIARSLAEVLEDVTLPQYRVLVVLCGEGPLRSGVLAERLGIHQSTLTRTADRLVAQGLIRRDTSQESRREILVDLTDSGRALVVRTLKQRSEDLRKILESVPVKDRKKIREGFRAFAEAAGEPEAGDLLTLGVS
jgi:DNA-binding MarR family transcriptional regulator